jgi:CDP-diacylglycerol--serine O-phosphatidyltransferase
MNFFKNNLANAITLGNLFSGCVGIVHLISGDYQTAAICLLISLILDFFDGFVARALKSGSNLGGQLDSLADMVSFGFLPGVAMMKMLERFGNQLFGIDLPFEIKYIGLLITLFSCLRLAIFNIDDEQTYYFKGLNTPTNTVLIFGLFYVYKEFGSFGFIVENEVLLLILTLVSSWILVSPVRMISMKFKSKKLADNYSKVVLLVGGILILAIFQFNGIPLIVIYYILVSLIFQRQLRS